MTTVASKTPITISATGESCASIEVELEAISDEKLEGSCGMFWIRKIAGRLAFRQQRANTREDVEQSRKRDIERDYGHEAPHDRAGGV